MPFTASQPVDTGRPGASDWTLLGPPADSDSTRTANSALPTLCFWAARYPDEVPLVNGEYAWIVSRLPG